jgi:hypothetical protein
MYYLYICILFITKNKKMDIKRLENRSTESESRNKMVSMIDLYEQYVDESIQTIRIWTSTMYIINDKWVVDITTNRVSISYPAPIG